MAESKTDPVPGNPTDWMWSGPPRRRPAGSVRMNGFGKASELRRISAGQVNGFGGNRAIGIGAGEQPFHRAFGAPVAAEQFQQPRRQQGLPILASFSEAHPEYVPRGVDVTHFELCGFGDAESRAVEHGQHGAMAETAGGLQ